MINSFKYFKINKSILNRTPILKFSSTQPQEIDQADYHRVKHTKFIMDPKFYENDIQPTLMEEIDFIRSPFYDLAKQSQLDEKNADYLIDYVTIKASLLEKVQGVTSKEKPSKEDIAYTRFADNQENESVSHLFRAPRGEPYRRINNAELFRVQKPQNHIEILKRQKQFLADKFFPPFDVRESNLKNLFDQNSQNIEKWQMDENQNGEEYEKFKENLIEIIPKLNHDILIQLALHLAYDAKLNDLQIWKSIEQAAMEIFHQLSLTQICQLEWAVQELKPKRTSARLNDFLIQKVLESIGRASREEIMYIMQGFRKRQKREIYVRVREALIKNKKMYFSNKKDEKEEKPKNLANMLFCIASNKPTKFGIYQRYYEEELNELLGIYEEDLKEGIMGLDEEHLTRMALALYLFKTNEFDNLWQRIERRSIELKDKLDHYHLCNIIKSFSRSQHNKMSASDKTYFKLEESVIKQINKLDQRDITHLMYSYSVRGVGNPDIYKVFDEQINKIVDDLDYPSLFNAIYYLMFTNNTDQQLWQRIIEATLKNKDILPIIYYKPFKASKFYLQGKLPQLDIRDYTDKFWYAERYFNQLQLEEYAYTDEQYIEFRKFLSTRCLVYPHMFMTKHNLFVLHYVFEEQKIAINLHLNKFLPGDRKEPTQMQKLGGKIMNLEGWEVLELSQRQFDDWETEEKIVNVKGWLKEAKEKQIQKGILPEKPVVYV